MFSSWRDKEQSPMMSAARRAPSRELALSPGGTRRICGNTPCMAQPPYFILL